MSHDILYLSPNTMRPTRSAELLKQLSELQRTVTAQGELLKRVLDGLESSSRPNSSAGTRQDDVGMASSRNRN